jgi:exosortase E/protease (VPEID-CTERM system)
MRRLSQRLRVAVAAAVLLGESLAFSAAFDFGGFIGTNEWWTRLLLQGPLLLRLGLTIAIAAVLFCGRDIWDELAAGEAEADEPARLLAFGLGHLTAIACLYALTDWLLRVAGHAVEFGSIGFLGWLVAVAMVGLTLARVALPARTWGRLAVRCGASLFVAALVGTVAWGGGLLSARMWEPLGQSTLWLVRGLLSLTGTELVYSPETFEIGTSRFAVEIAPQCSGYEGVGLILAFLGGYLWLARRQLRFPHSLLLLPLGAGLVWLANAGRIAALILIGSWYSPQVALGGFHSQAGWLAFNAIALGLILLTHQTRVFVRVRGGSRPEVSSGRASQVTAYLAPLLVLLAATMATAACTSGFDWLYPVRVVAVGGVLWYFRASYPRLRWSGEATALGLLVFVVWVALDSTPVGQPMPAELARLSAPWAALWLVARVLGSCLIVPAAEELAFRGYLTRRLISNRVEDVPIGQFTWLSLVVSSVLFGLMHDRWLAGVLAGAVYALALYRRRELSDAVLAHATTNGALAAYVLATGSWGFWS